MPADFFTLSYHQLKDKLLEIEPLEYARSRNFLSGAVTHLGPYITHGILQLPDIIDEILSRHQPEQCQTLFAEFAWREYFQYVWLENGDAIFNNLQQQQASAKFAQPAQCLVEGNSGIEVIDEACKVLTSTGYLHNHARMWTAFVHCHVAKTHWLQPARWLYYHLLDGDLASNFLSWQWVAGTSRNRIYVANQQNLNQFSASEQRNTCIDTTYLALENLDMPSEYTKRGQWDFPCALPKSDCQFDSLIHATTLCYSIWNLDPTWHANQQCNRILLLEPSHFHRFLLSEKRWQFILHWARQIDGLQIFVGEFSDFKHALEHAQVRVNQRLLFREHPSHAHWQGECEPRRFVWPKPLGKMKGFFPFWKQAQKSSPW